MGTLDLLDKASSCHYSSIATTSADEGQKRSDVTRPFSTSEGKPSQTSVVTSANSTVSGSMCQEYPTFTSEFPRMITPFGIRGALLPLSNFRATSIPVGSVNRILYYSVSATRNVTITPFFSGEDVTEPVHCLEFVTSSILDSRSNNDWGAALSP